MLTLESLIKCYRIIKNWVCSKLEKICSDSIEMQMPLEKDVVTRSHHSGIEKLNNNNT